MIVKLSCAARASDPNSVMRRMAGAAVLLSCLAPMASAFGSDEAVYVTGKGTSIDQVFKKALANAGSQRHDRFWVVVAGGDVRHVTRERAKKDVLEWVQRVREQGGIVYVCRSDLAREGIKEDELLDGVAEIYGYDKKDWAGLLPARKDGIVLPESMRQSQLILKTCAADDISAQ